MKSNFEFLNSHFPVLANFDTMKKAILARALRGELGTNDPAEEWAGELVKKLLSEEV